MSEHGTCDHLCYLCFSTIKVGLLECFEIIPTCLVRKNIFEIWLTPTTDSRKWWDEVHYARTVGFGI